MVLQGTITKKGKNFEITNYEEAGPGAKKKSLQTSLKVSFSHNDSYTIFCFALLILPSQKPNKNNVSGTECFLV